MPKLFAQCFFIARLVFPIQTSASTKPPIEPIQALLEKTQNLGAKSLSVRKKNSQWEISFCPDNTCDVIRAPLAADPKAVADFTLLYLFYGSSYVYLKQFVLKDAPSFARSTLERLKGTCRGDEVEVASCAMLAVAKSNRIAIAFSRTDEGGSGVDERKVDELSAERLSQTRKWQLEAWRNYP